MVSLIYIIRYNCIMETNSAINYFDDNSRRKYVRITRRVVLECKRLGHAPSHLNSTFGLCVLLTRLDERSRSVTKHKPTIVTASKPLQLTFPVNRLRRSVIAAALEYGLEIKHLTSC